MGNYYFVTASLPMLQYDKPAGITRGYFLELCGAHLKPADFEQLAEAELFGYTAQTPRSTVYTAYREWETELRNELVKLRAPRLGRDAESFLKQGEVVLAERALARRAFDEASPLQAEELLNKARWQYLEELEFGHYFDLHKLIVYYLKLQLLLRRSLFKTEQGRETFTAIEQRVFEELKAGVEAYGT